jgi:hypothetical protein
MGDVSVVQTVVVDKSAAQLSAVRRCMPAAKVLLCSVHVFNNFTDKVKSLSGVSPEDKELFTLWLNRLLYCRSVEEFNIYKAAITGANAELDAYLNAHWMDCTESWAAYARKGIFHMKNGTTNRVEAANRYLKEGLTPSSSVYDAIKVVLRRNKDLDFKYTMAVRMPLVRPLPRELEKLPGCLNVLSIYAQLLIAENVEKSTELSLTTSTGAVFVDGHMVTGGSIHSCTCSFYADWMLPCRHVVYMVTHKGLDISQELLENHYLRRPDISVINNNPQATTSFVSVVHPKGNKLSIARNATADYLEALMSLGADAFEEQIRFLRELTDAVTKTGRGDVAALVSQDVVVPENSNEAPLA